MHTHHALETPTSPLHTVMDLCENGPPATYDAVELHDMVGGIYVLFFIDTSAICNCISM